MVQNEPFRYFREFVRALPFLQPILAALMSAGMREKKGDRTRIGQGGFEAYFTIDETLVEENTGQMVCSCGSAAVSVGV